MARGRLNFAVIGAGMGGLATAAALRKAGIAVTIYEQARQFTRLGRATRSAAMRCTCCAG